MRSDERGASAEREFSSPFKAAIFSRIATYSISGVTMPFFA